MATTSHQPRRIAVLGASGGTGRQLVEHAVARGIAVTAVVRDPAKYGAPTGDSVSVAVADGRDDVALAEAFRGVDAVAFALGAGNEVDTILGDGIRATLTAMHAAGVDRVVAISGTGVTTEGDGAFRRAVLTPMVQRMYRTIFPDKLAMEQALKASDAQWTIVRPAKLTDGKAKGYRAGVGKNIGGLGITRSDMADAMLDFLGDPKTERQIVFVRN